MFLCSYDCWGLMTVCDDVYGFAVGHHQFVLKPFTWSVSFRFQSFLFIPSTTELRKLRVWYWGEHLLHPVYACIYHHNQQHMQTECAHDVTQMHVRLALLDCRLTFCSTTLPHTGRLPCNWLWISPLVRLYDLYYRKDWKRKDTNAVTNKAIKCTKVTVQHLPVSQFCHPVWKLEINNTAHWPTPDVVQGTLSVIVCRY